MNIELLHFTPLWVCAKAIRKCWASEDKSDSERIDKCLRCGSTDIACELGSTKGYCETCDSSNYQSFIICGEKDKELIERVGNKNKHKSTLEHLVYTFDVDGISRACLQEVARHRMASYSVKSTRYTLKELKDEAPFLPLIDFERAGKYLVYTGIDSVDKSSVIALENIRGILAEGVANDRAKYCLPESYKTELTWTINARSLQNFLHLRTSKSALWEIRDLANAIYEELPLEHKYLFTDILCKD